MKKNKLTLYFALLSLIVTLCGCTSPQSTADSGEKLNIVCTIFPQYDFCREIVGESADVNLLIDRAVDLHSYEPTASDIVEISKCDVFITVGGVSDNWVDAALNASGNEKGKCAVDCRRIEHHGQPQSFRIFDHPLFVIINGCLEAFE